MSLIELSLRVNAIPGLDLSLKLLAGRWVGRWVGGW